MESKKSAFKLALPYEHFNFYLNTTWSPDIFNMRQRIDCEKQNPDRLIAEVQKALFRLLKSIQTQSLRMIETTSSSPPTMPETRERVVSAPIASPRELRMDPIENSDLTTESRHVFKRKRLWLSRSVIRKSILRSFEEYFIKEIYIITDFKIDIETINSQETLLDLANKFISQKFPENPFSDLNLFIIALGQPVIVKTLKIDPKLEELYFLVKRVLYRHEYGDLDVSVILSYPQFSFILKEFLSIPNIIEFLLERYVCLHAASKLVTQISILIEKWSKVLADHNTSSACDQIINPQTDS